MNTYKQNMKLAHRRQRIAGLIFWIGMVLALVVFALADPVVG